MHMFRQTAFQVCRAGSQIVSYTHAMLATATYISLFFYATKLLEALFQKHKLVEGCVHVRLVATIPVAR